MMPCNQLLLLVVVAEVVTTITSLTNHRLLAAAHSLNPATKKGLVVCKINDLVIRIRKVVAHSSAICVLAKNYKYSIYPNSS